MGDSQPTGAFEPFAILTRRLILLPTPIAVSLKSYLALYSQLHADVGFCTMAFGDLFPPRKWDDDSTRGTIQNSDIELSWERHGLGDFAVGLLASSGESDLSVPASMRGENDQATIIRGHDFEQLSGPNNSCLADIEWAGYTGVRDATTTSMPSQETGDPTLPPWHEMIELRYGISPTFWGKGIAKEAAEAVMQWSAREKGVKRFIAETERDNERSAKVLEKLGFTRSGTNYWKEPSQVEWARFVE